MTRFNKLVLTGFVLILALSFVNQSLANSNWIPLDGKYSMASEDLKLSEAWFAKMGIPRKIVAKIKRAGLKFDGRSDFTIRECQTINVKVVGYYGAINNVRISYIVAKGLHKDGSFRKDRLYFMSAYSPKYPNSRFGFNFLPNLNSETSSEDLQKNVMEVPMNNPRKFMRLRIAK